MRAKRPMLSVSRYGGQVPAPKEQPRIYSGAMALSDPVFIDIPDEEERLRIAGESDPNVLRVEIYKGFVLKKYRPYNLWRIHCREDFSECPKALAGAYTDQSEVKKAINDFLEKDVSTNEGTTD